MISTNKRLVGKENSSIADIKVLTPSKGVYSGDSKAKRIKVKKGTYTYDKSAKKLIFDGTILKGAITL